LNGGNFSLSKRIPGGPGRHVNIRLHQFDIRQSPNINGVEPIIVLYCHNVYNSLSQVSGEFIYQHCKTVPQRTGRARRSTSLSRRLSTPAFITPDLWPPSSLDLNPDAVDYKIWGLASLSDNSACRTWTIRGSV